ncbi:MAG: hypothetical protein WCD79_16820 [Chthoniobacteraceae bacterium]
MKLRLFNHKIEEEGYIAPTDKRILKSDAALGRAQTLLNEIKANMAAFGSELDAAMAEAKK